MQFCCVLESSRLIYSRLHSICTAFPENSTDHLHWQAKHYPLHRSSWAFYRWSIQVGTRKISIPASNQTFIMSHSQILFKMAHFNLFK